MNDVPLLLSILGINAKRRGREWEAPCPIHHDSDPSWHIEDETGRWYCFGCTQGGSVVNLVEKLKNLGWKEAIEWLKSNGISDDSLEAIGTPCVDIPSVGVPAKFKPPFGCNFKPFEKWPSGYRNYVLNRGITTEQAIRWGLGYAVDGRLASRVVFPCIDRYGRMASYSARAIDGSQPRYLTPDPRENPDPTVVFGEQFWGDDHTYVVVTEGAINALACERAGARNVGSLSGSPITPLDTSKNRPATVPGSVLVIVQKLSWFDHVILAVDPDKAGDKVFAAVSALGRWKPVTRVAIPVGQDAATLSREDLRRRLIDVGIAH